MLYWLLREPATKEDIPQVESILRRLAFSLGADMGATDASRVLRVPHTWNLKYKPCPLVTVRQLDSSLKYNLSDFDFLPEASKQQPEKATDWQDKLLEGVSEGDRNSTATRLAGRWFAKGQSESEVLFFLLAWNQRNNPPLPEKEIEAIVKSIGDAHKRNSGPTIKQKRRCPQSLLSLDHLGKCF